MLANVLLSSALFIYLLYLLYFYPVLSLLIQLSPGGLQTNNKIQ